jgi:hypothetical protein
MLILPVFPKRGIFLSIISNRLSFPFDFLKTIRMEGEREAREEGCKVGRQTNINANREAFFRLGEIASRSAISEGKK